MYGRNSNLHREFAETERILRAVWRSRNGKRAASAAAPLPQAAGRA